MDRTRTGPAALPERLGRAAAPGPLRTEAAGRPGWPERRPGPGDVRRGHALTFAARQPRAGRGEPVRPHRDAGQCRTQRAVGGIRRTGCAIGPGKGRCRRARPGAGKRAA